MEGTVDKRASSTPGRNRKSKDVEYITADGGETKVPAIIDEDDEGDKETEDMHPTHTGGLSPLAAVLSVICCPFTLLCSWYVVSEKEEAVLLSYGSFNAIEKDAGCHFATCFGRDLRKVNKRIQSLDLPNTKVVDRSGSPLIVSGIVVFHIDDAKRAALDVTNATQFVYNEAQAVIKKVVSRFPYESHHQEGEPEEASLKTEAAIIQSKMQKMLQRATRQAGAFIHSFQFNELSYAPEIAAGMLRRQQAKAMLAARKVIVQGAVDLAYGAVDSLAEKGIKMQPEEKTRLVSNLLTVICSDTESNNSSTQTPAHDHHRSGPAFFTPGYT